MPKRNEPLINYDNYYVTPHGVMVIFARNGNIRQESSAKPPPVADVTFSEIENLLKASKDIEEITKLSDRLLSTVI